MKSWYFAYGSNLWIEQMMERTDAMRHAEDGPRIARLANHRLAFQQIDNAGPAYANIVCPGEGVLGVVYRCSPEDLDRLDRYERGYERQPITVIDRSGEELAAVVYVISAAQAANTGRPSAEYLKRIVTGARQHGLPEEYIDNLVTIALSATLQGS
jgi:gamma-glutamylcyclotransferase